MKTISYGNNLSKQQLKEYIDTHLAARKLFGFISALLRNTGLQQMNDRILKIDTFKIITHIMISDMANKEDHSFFVSYKCSMCELFITRLTQNL